MTREQFLAMIEASPNKDRLKHEYAAQEQARISALPDVPVYPKGVKGEEKALQATCEGWLRQKGYRPSTAAEMVASVKPDATPVKGWYIHLHNCERNPLLPDLIVLDADMTRCICIELKVASVYQPGQAEFIKAGCWREVRTFIDFRVLIEDWEGMRIK